MREYATHEEARAALVRAWAQATRAGQSALLVATRDDDVGAMNELAREALRERLGEKRVYATDFGERVFAIGELLVARERAREGVNGDRYTLAAHRDDGRLWDLHEHRAIDHGYATTSYRSQSRNRRCRLRTGLVGGDAPGTLRRRHAGPRKRDDRLRQGRGARLRASS